MEPELDLEDLDSQSEIEGYDLDLDFYEFFYTRRLAISFRKFTKTTLRREREQIRQDNALADRKKEVDHLL